MLTIARALYEKIIEHARKDHPDEACGVIAGPIGSDTPTRFIPMQNAERSPTFYRFDSLEQAIFGLLLAGIGRDEIARTLHIDATEIETRQWAMLRKLERLD